MNEKAIPRKFRKTMGRSAIMAYFSAKEAIDQAGLDHILFESGRVGVSFASTTGSTLSMQRGWEEFILNKVKSNLPTGLFFQIMSYTSAANIACAFNVQGRVLSPNSACSSSSQAIGFGYENIRNGYHDIMLCGGSDELHSIITASFDGVNATSFRYNDRPEASPRPFGKDRDGTAYGDGAGCLILESEESALARGAEIFGEVIGFATLSNGIHMATPNAPAIVRCMNQLLKDSSLKPEEIDYVNAHATDTLSGDIAEAQAIKQVFGVHSVAVSALKGYIGHTIGASGVLETIASIEAMNNDEILPTKNLDTPCEKCDIIRHVTTLEKQYVRTFIKNNFAFGGINTSIAIRNPKNNEE